MPPIAPTTPSATLPPAVIRGKRVANNMIGHQTASKPPMKVLNIKGSRCGKTFTPMGIPTNPPRTNGSRFDQEKPRRTVNAASSWPVSAPKTVIAAARRGSMVHAQNDIATIPKPNPDNP